MFPPADDGDKMPGPLLPWPLFDDDDAFMLLHPGSSESMILHATREGRTVVYDADKHAFSATTVPSFDAGMGREPIVFSVPGGEETESLYVMRSTTINSSDRRRHHRCSGEFVVLDFNQRPLQWQPLPRPPFLVDMGNPECSEFHIRSWAVVDGGRTIVVLFYESNGYFVKGSDDESDDDFVEVGTW